MSQENCNLDKDEAEILKTPSTPSNPSPSQPNPPAISNPSSSRPPPSALSIKPLQQLSAGKSEIPEESCKPKAMIESQPSVQFGNRCFSCQKRVGLTGFRCRCGDLFCVKHRFSDTHDCSFDYKALGREEITKNNPLIRAAKIIKI